MPRVPAAPDTVVTESVRSAPLRIPLQSVAGAGVDASGLVRGLDEFTDARIRSDNQLSQIRISAAETEILNFWNARLNTDKDAFYKDGGQSGFERLEPSMQELDDFEGKVCGGLKTATECQILTDALALRRMNHRTKMSLTAFGWRQDWDKTTAQANRIAQYEAAVNDPSPENLRLTRERVIDETNTISKIQDFAEPDSDIAIQNAETAVSQMYTAAIEGVIASDRPFLALEMLNRYGKKGTGEIQFDAETKLRERLNEITLASESRDLANEAAEHSDDPREQLKFIRRKYGENPDPRETEIIERSLQKATIRANQEATAEGRVKADNYDRLATAISHDAADGGSINVLDDLRRGTQGDELFEFITSEQLSNLERLARGNFRQDDRIWTTLSMMTEAKLKTVDPWKFRPFLDDTHYEDLLDMIRFAKSPSSSIPMQNIMSANQALRIRLEAENIEPGTELGVKLTDEIQERIDYENVTNPDHKLLPSEINKIINEQLTEVILPAGPRSGVLSAIKDFFVDPSKKILIGELKLLDIPSGQVHTLMDEYENFYGVAPTKNELLDYYGFLLDTTDRFK